MNSRHGHAPIHLAILSALFLVAWALSALNDADAQDAALDQTIKAEWQIITYTGTATIRRTRTPSGWFVIIQSDNGDNDPMIIPDPKHEWLNIEAERTNFGSYVTADRATYDALLPEIQMYMKYVSKDPKRSRIQKTLESWRARIEAAEANLR